MKFRLFFSLGLAVLSLVTGCASTSYPPTNTTIGETKEWSMPLNREPGRIQLKLQMAAGTSASINLETATEFEQAPVRLYFSGSDCAKGPEGYVRYSVSSGDFRYKHFKAPLVWQDDITVSIDWDEKGQTVVSVDGEKITAQPYIGFKTFKISSHTGTANIKELSYTSMAATALTQNGAPQ